jgi:tricorn protease
VLAPQDGIGAAREIELPEPSFVFTPSWSPDSRSIALHDTHLQLWVVDVEERARARVDTDNYMVPERSMNPVWSPDSRWIAYAKRLDNLLRAIFVYDVETAAASRSPTACPTRRGRRGTRPASTSTSSHRRTTAQHRLARHDVVRPARDPRRLPGRAAKGEPSPLLPRSDEEGRARGRRFARGRRDARAAARRQRVRGGRRERRRPRAHGASPSTSTASMERILSLASSRATTRSCVPGRKAPSSSSSRAGSGVASRPAAAAPASCTAT